MFQAQLLPRARCRRSSERRTVTLSSCAMRTYSLTLVHHPLRQCNMDYILLSTLILTAAQLFAIFISYDIACSFSINFFRRLLKFPEHLQFDFEDIQVMWAVPKFHLLAHGKKCQGRYSLNHQRGVGRTHGETIESNWALTNGFALSTREMTAAGRHEVLNDAMGQVNWSKTTKIRTLNLLYDLLRNELVLMRSRRHVVQRPQDRRTRT